MKSFLVAILGAIAVGALAYPKIQYSAAYRGGIDPRGVIEDEINSTLEGIRKDIPEPVEVETLNIKFPSGGFIEGELDLKNVKASGIKGFQLRALKVNAFTRSTTFTLVLPNIVCKNKYTGDVKVKNLDLGIALKGTGDSDLTLMNLQFKGSAKVNLLETLISINNLKLELSLGGVKAKVNGLVGGPDADATLNKWLNANLVGFIADNQKAISESLGPAIEKIINDLLNGNEKFIE